MSLDNVVTGVSSKNIEKYWKKVSPLLTKALDETYNIEDIYEGLIAKKMQLFISINKNQIECAVVTEIAVYPQSKVLRYFLAGGINLDNWLDRIQDAIQDFAKSQNCTHLEVAGRKGWVRKLKGFKIKAYLLNKEI